jgi:hypothetical protein
VVDQAEGFQRKGVVIDHQNDDASTPYEELRKKKLAAWATWWSKAKPAPPGWSVHEQLKTAGF